MADLENIQQIPSLNPTLNRLLHESERVVMLHFAGAVVTSDIYLEGPGRYSGDGFAMPFAGEILSIHVWDGSNVQNSTVESTFAANDRICVFAHYDAPWFDVFVRKNGVNTSTYAIQVQPISNLAATVLIKLHDPIT